MGRATIVSGGTDGRYTIDLDYGSAVRDARVAKLTAKIAELEARALWQQELLDGFTGGLESIENEFNALVSEFVALSNAVPRDQAAMDAKRKQIDEKTKELLKQQEWTASAQADLGMTKSAIKSTTLERGALLTAEVTETRQAWCTDLTEGATGAVATLEVPGESSLILIQPGAPAPTAIHGALVAREVQSPGQVFWNAAVLPGWQKFKPTYRWGTITSLDQNADTCSVALADAKSSAQQLGVNQSDTLTAVPIRYMECNSSAFAVGDRVIVEFAGNDWAAPVVIGFVDNPKPCAWVLSGVVLGGEIVSTPSLALRSHRPTPNAWETVLASDPLKGPGAFADETKLGKAGDQYRRILASQFSGLMSKAVQVILGRGRTVVYKSDWEACHGILMSGTQPWLIEISAARGVLAMKLPVTKASGTSTNDAVAHSVALFGGVPTGAGFPDDISAAIAAGTVRQLMTPEWFSEVSSKNTYSDYMGWSFNDLGTEAHNTCWHVTDEGQYIGCHYRLLLSSTSASLELVSSGRLIQRKATLYVVPGAFVNNFLAEESLVAWKFDGGLTDIPRESGVDGHDIITDQNVTVFVCHIAGELHQVTLQQHAYVESRDTSAGRPHLSTIVSDGIAMVTGGDSCYQYITGNPEAGAWRATVAYGCSTSDIRDAYMIFEEPKIEESYGPYQFDAARIHVATPDAVRSTSRSDTTKSRVAENQFMVLGVDVNRYMAARFSTFGEQPQIMTDTLTETAQFPASVRVSHIEGNRISDIEYPSGDFFNFTGYL